MPNRSSLFVFLSLAAVCAVGFLSCAGGPDAESTVMEQNRGRSYERFKADHAANAEADLNKAGIHVLGRDIFVVISLTDSGTDRFPEWACDRLLTALYGYRAVDQATVSDDEFYELVLKFELVGIIEGKYENLARIKVSEKDVASFVENVRK